MSEEQEQATPPSLPGGGGISIWWEMVAGVIVTVAVVFIFDRVSDAIPDDKRWLMVAPVVALLGLFIKDQLDGGRKGRLVRDVENRTKLLDAIKAYEPLKEVDAKRVPAELERMQKLDIRRWVNADVYDLPFKSAFSRVTAYAIIAALVYPFVREWSGPFQALSALGVGIVVTLLFFVTLFLRLRRVDDLTPRQFLGRLTSKEEQ